MTLPSTRKLRVGMVGCGMIFDETYMPAFEARRRCPLFRRSTGAVEVELVGIASRTGNRAAALRSTGRLGSFQVFSGVRSVEQLLDSGVDLLCIATPDDRHYHPARMALMLGKHVLIEKPSVLKLAQLDELQRLADEQGVLAKVVYHKLLDPDHKRLRTLVEDQVLRQVTNGYASLLEPKVISNSTFAEWIGGRNPATYVAVHYIKLIDFTFGGRLRSVTAHGQRGQVASPESATWDSVQLHLEYVYPAGATACFDIHTSWVHPDNFPGYVEQEVQFRFENGVWNGHSRKRGVELVVEGRTPLELKNSLNNHYNAIAIEPWGERRPRGYGIEAIDRFFEEVARVEFGGPRGDRSVRLREARALAYNDLSADRQVVAAVESLEAILGQEVAGNRGARVTTELAEGGLVLELPGKPERTILYPHPL